MPASCRACFQYFRASLDPGLLGDVCDRPSVVQLTQGFQGSDKKITQRKRKPSTTHTHKKKWHQVWNNEQKQSQPNGHDLTRKDKCQGRLAEAQRHCCKLTVDWDGASMGSFQILVAFRSPAKSLTFSGLMENPFVGKKLKS